MTRSSPPKINKHELTYIVVLTHSLSSIKPAFFTLLSNCFIYLLVARYNVIGQGVLHNRGAGDSTHPPCLTSYNLYCQPLLSPAFQTQLIPKQELIKEMGPNSIAGEGLLKASTIHITNTTDK